MTKLYRNKSWLKKKYIEENLHSKDIAKICGVQQCTILKWTNKFGLKKKNPSLTEKNKLVNTNPDLIKEWSDKNKNPPDQYSYGSNEKVWWVCKNNHKWEASISSRAKGHGCPYCYGLKKTRDQMLDKTHPELVTEWSNKNTIKPSEVSYGSSKKVWWVCNKGHEWKTNIFNRGSHGHGCPKCCHAGMSSWEKAYKKHLDEQGINYISQPEKLETPSGSYYPDFYLRDEDKYVEIKAKFWESKNNQSDRINWLKQEDNLNIEKLYGDDLRKLGLIK